jgi:predicted transposase YbfD/YdcC
VSGAGRTLLTHWHGIQTLGVLHRTGTRTGKDGKITKVDETIGFISSRVLSAEAITTHLHSHWCIENNLHWVKDEVFGEDKHTLRQGKAPQVMSCIRSMCITVCNVLKMTSISDVIHNVQKSTRLLEQFLRMGAIV